MIRLLLITGSLSMRRLLLIAGLSSRPPLLLLYDQHLIDTQAHGWINLSQYMDLLLLLKSNSSVIIHLFGSNLAHFKTFLKNQYNSIVIKSASGLFDLI